MPPRPKTSKLALDARYQFAEDSFPGATGAWQSQLHSAIGTEDGEQYLIRLFKKTGTPLDTDLSQLIARGLRRIRRVLSSRRSRDLLVEVREVAEDRDELAIVMLDPGRPIAGSARAVHARHNAFLSTAGRKVFWRNIARVAEALAICHDAGIVHGSVSEHALFSHGGDIADYRLGGYEMCLHIGDGELGSADHFLRPAGAISFRQDWIDLGQTARAILGVTSNSGPSLLAIERRMLDRLAMPPQFQLFDGAVVTRELGEVIEELDRVGTSSEGELVLYPSPQVIQSDLPSLTSGTVAAHDADALLQFVGTDLCKDGLRAQPVRRGFVRIVTDLAVYDVKIVDDRIGMLVKAHKRRHGDRIYDAIELSRPLHLSRNRRGAEERVRKLGLGAVHWADLGQDGQAGSDARDESPWHALVVLEAFTWLREQFRFYPVEVLPASHDDDTNTIWLSSREEAERDQRRTRLGLRPTTEALRRELRYDDGKTEWTVSKSDTLAGDGGLPPDLRYLGDLGQLHQQAFAFTSTAPLTPGSTYYLRPRRDMGFEQATRRRLQNIVAARSNVDLLRAIDDPAQVALDQALRDIAAPGVPPEYLDGTKSIAWKSIAEGKSINVVVGPPGVGKTYLISQLVRSILSLTHDARVLISAQNHETLIQMEAELKKALAATSAIVIRVERARVDAEISTIRAASTAVLNSACQVQGDAAAIMTSQLHQIKQALNPRVEAEQTVADRVLRDTDHLLLRSSDVTLATTSSSVIEEMIADGEQFDWVIIEEAARANGAELIGALLLGNRRVMIGDHNQLSPFDVSNRQKLYDTGVAAELLKDARAQLSTISDLPKEVETTFQLIESDSLLLQDVLAAASRLEEAFRSIAEREAEREKSTGRPSSLANTLLEQSRMHPAICQLVSNTFYRGDLVPSERVKERELTVMPGSGFPLAPILVLDLPPLSIVQKREFEQRVGQSYRNQAEATALLSALKCLRPVRDKNGHLPSLVILSPYLAQVQLLERMLKHEINQQTGTLFGFESPRRDGKFFFTSDSFQGGEADVVVASLVRNNSFVGARALGFIRNPQRMNVLLSRAKQRLVLATSQRFIREAVDGVDPEGLGGDLDFLRTMLGEVDRLTTTMFDGNISGAAIVNVDEHGNLLL